MVSWLKSCLDQRRGVTSIEYALAAGLIALLIVAGVRAVGTSVSTLYGNVGSSL